MCGKENSSKIDKMINIDISAVLMLFIQEVCGTGHYSKGGSANYEYHQITKKVESFRLCECYGGRT